MVQKISLQENIFYQATMWFWVQRKESKKKFSHGSNKESLVLDSCRANGKKQQQYKHWRDTGPMENDLNEDCSFSF